MQGLIESAANSAKAMRKARSGELRPAPQFDIVEPLDSNDEQPDRLTREELRTWI